MARIYLDASLMSACVSGRTDTHSVYRREVSLESWTAQRPRHECIISEGVLVELSHPTHKTGDAAMELANELPMVSITEEVRG